MTAWRALLDEVQADEDVRGLNILWQLPDDNEADDPAPREVLTVRVVPEFGQETIFACAGNGKSVWETAIAVNFAITIPGESADNSANVWDAIWQAANVAESRLSAYGVAWLDDPTFTPSVEDTVTAIGTVAFTFHREY